MLKYSTIALITGLILFSIITVKEESTLAACAAFTCGFILVCKVGYSIDRWLGFIEDEADKRPL